MPYTTHSSSQVILWVISLCISLFLPLKELYATHVRAGDLTAERIQGSTLTYKFTATIYTDDEGVPPDPEIEFDFGTGEKRNVSRVLSVGVGNATTKNQYVTTYTFPGPGEYAVGVSILNRNAGILNIPNSVNVAFYIESTFVISPFLGINTSPVLLVAPIDFAARGKIFIHNPGAYDADGDSLAYKMVVCKKSKGSFVDGFSDPNDPKFGGTNTGGGPATLTLDARTGDLVWNTPGEPGQYNVAFIVEEWRDGFLIGQVNRDMQIIVRDNRNNPPKVNDREICVTAGTRIREDVITSDPDNDRVLLTAQSALFEQAPPPQYISVPPRNYATLSVSGAAQPRGVLQWQTTCQDVRLEPYQITFKAEDQPAFSPQDKLVDLQTWRIRVVGPKPSTPRATVLSSSRSIRLEWDSYLCQNASEMMIYRREGPFPFEPDTCQTGLPEFTGYRKIGEVPITQTDFLDSNNGQGLKRGVTYCYRLVAKFPLPGGSESYTSREVCTEIVTNAPYMTNVSIEKTDVSNGEVFVRWSLPELQTPLPRPYTFRLARAESFSGTSAYTFVGGTFAESDTFFTDKNLNTANKVYNYRVFLYSQNNLVDSSAASSSVRLSGGAAATSLNLTWQAQTAWTNLVEKFPTHYIYRQNDVGAFVLYDSVNAVGSGLKYSDTGKGVALDPDKTYCYIVETQGSYNKSILPEPLKNKSQSICLKLLDVKPPCAPAFVTMDSLDCKDFNPEDPRWCTDSLFKNDLSWRSIAPPCDQDVKAYRVYYKPTLNAPYQLLVETTDTVFSHQLIRTLAGCYYITAIDFSGNESERSQEVCNDNCPGYRLPNVITPNGDGQNDEFNPFACPPFVEIVRFWVYNRWNKEVYNSDNDIYINWRGVDNQGDVLASGTYFYIAEVRFKRLNPDNSLVKIKGWIQILR